MKRIISNAFTAAAMALMLLAAASCSKAKFNIDGIITEAADSLLYFENMSLNGPVVIDSVRLTAEGTFAFSDNAPEAPEFYRLRIAGQVINLSVDSTEHITVKASMPNMAAGYEVEGSDECATIKELAVKQMTLQKQINDTFANPEYSFQNESVVIDTLVENYKNDIRSNYIYKAPMRASSYFALFQTINTGGLSRLIFNPRTSKSDVDAFAAVATSWDAYHPGAKRGENLHNIAIEGMKTIRLIRANESKAIDISKVNVSNIVDIELADNKGVIRRLSDLQGKVVLLDFHLFASRGSTERIMALRDIYNKYHAQGLEIYQVSVDPDEHFWKTQTAALPWICVHESQADNGITLTKYNVQAVPTFFLLDKNCVPHKRDVQIKDIDAEIKSLL